MQNNLRGAAAVGGRTDVKSIIIISVVVIVNVLMNVPSSIGGGRNRLDDDEYDLASMRDSFMKEFAARPLEYVIIDVIAIAPFASHRLCIGSLLYVSMI
jgi:hypothetical protein